MTIQGKYWMFNVVVDRSVDKGIVHRGIKRFFGKWIHVSDEPVPDSFNIILILSHRCSKPELYSADTVRVCIGKLNGFEIARLIEYGRAIIRLAVSWNGKTYLLSPGGLALEDYRVHPAFDLLIWRSDEAAWILEELGVRTGSNPLLYKRFGGEYMVYSGPRITARLRIGDQGIDIAGEQVGGYTLGNSLEAFINENKPVLERYLSITYRFLESLGEPDRVVVSFSGGKDSLVVLDIAINHYGRDMIDVIYVDTGVDFPWTRKYIDRVEEFYGVEVRRVRAKVLEEISRHGLPSRNNRWCTLLKTAAFKSELGKIAGKYSKVLVLVGDRDTESEARARKPPVRRRRGYLEAAPLKQWATIHVQHYIWSRGLPLNPLYKLGFYRLGCYICPALTSLERFIMLRKLLDRLRGMPWFEKYISMEIGQ